MYFLKWMLYSFAVTYNWLLYFNSLAHRFSYCCDSSWPQKQIDSGFWFHSTSQLMNFTSIRHIKIINSEVWSIHSLTSFDHWKSTGSFLHKSDYSDYSICLDCCLINVFTYRSRLKFELWIALNIHCKICDQAYVARRLCVDIAA